MPEMRVLPDRGIGGDPRREPCADCCGGQARRGKVSCNSGDQGREPCRRPVTEFGPVRPGEGHGDPHSGPKGGGRRSGDLGPAAGSMRAAGQAVPDTVRGRAGRGAVGPAGGPAQSGQTRHHRAGGAVRTGYRPDGSRPVAAERRLETLVTPALGRPPLPHLQPPHQPELTPLAVTDRLPDEVTPSRRILFPGTFPRRGSLVVNIRDATRQGVPGETLLPAVGPDDHPDTSGFAGKMAGRSPFDRPAIPRPTVGVKDAQSGPGGNG